MMLFLLLKEYMYKDESLKTPVQYILETFGVDWKTNFGEAAFGGEAFEDIIIRDEF